MIWIAAIATWAVALMFLFLASAIFEIAGEEYARGRPVPHWRLCGWVLMLGGFGVALLPGAWS